MRHITVGHRVSRLTFVELLPPSGGGRHRKGIWRCDCGKETSAENSRVLRGLTKSCGCLSAERTRESHTKHGRRGAPEYGSWIAMIRRCTNVDHKDYPRYGAIGITVCDKWRDFAAFFSDMGERPVGTTLDRIDWRKGYQPDNCRWATPATQSRNRRDFTIVSTPKGIMPLIDYAAEIGLTGGAAHMRRKRGKLEGCRLV